MTSTLLQSYINLGPSDLSPYVQPFHTHCYKLATGISCFDPGRQSGPGRFLDGDKAKIFLGSNLQVPSGEVCGREPVPDDSCVGLYRLSGILLIAGHFPEEIQSLLLASNGPTRHDSSQQFTNGLFEKRLITSNIIGWNWKSVSGNALGIEGCCFGLWETGSHHLTFLGSAPWHERHKLENLLLSTGRLNLTGTVYGS